MFGCCPSKLDREMLPLHLWILAKITTRSMESLYFLNIIGNGNDLDKHLESFAYLPGGKSTCPGEFNFPAELFEFNFNPRCKNRWLPGHLDRVF